MRSDIAIALKTEFVEGFEKVAKENGWDLEEQTDNIRVHEEGKLWYFTHIKWYDCNPECVALMSYLQECGEENYKTVEACGEYPDSTEGDAGSWYDNPFRAYRAVSVSIEFEN